MILQAEKKTDRVEPRRAPAGTWLQSTFPSRVKANVFFLFFFQTWHVFRKVSDRNAVFLLFTNNNVSCIKNKIKIKSSIWFDDLIIQTQFLGKLGNVGDLPAMGKRNVILTWTSSSDCQSKSLRHLCFLATTCCWTAPKVWKTQSLNNNHSKNENNLGAADCRTIFISFRDH